MSEKKWKKWPEEVPPSHGPYLCVCRTYDSAYQGGMDILSFDVAYDPENRWENQPEEGISDEPWGENAWSLGKQSNTPEKVYFWTELDPAPEVQ